MPSVVQIHYPPLSTKDVNDLDDKEIDKQRYDNKAKIESQNNPQAIPKWSIEPYQKFYELIADHLSEGEPVLEIGSGTGAHTEEILNTGVNLMATDISPESLKILKKKFGKFNNLSIKECDMERLPFPNNYFNTVISAGSLSYGDNTIVMNEIYRVLRPKGKYICIDSLNNNLIYRLNRWIHYLKGDRTKSTLKRMPNIDLLKTYNCKFGTSSVYFFGSLTWLIPVLNKLIGEARSAEFLKISDKLIRTKKSAFKFVMIAQKTK